MKLSLLKSDFPEQDKDIFVHELKSEIKEIVTLLGGIKKTSNQLGWKISKTKDLGIRQPISIKDLKILVKMTDTETKNRIVRQIESKDLFISPRKSAIKVKFPNQLNSNLSYILAIILGDGSLSGDKQNIDGKWYTGVFFDNKEHRETYNQLVQSEFKISPKTRQPKTNCYESYINSKVFHWVLRAHFDMHNSYKANKIITPKKVLDANNEIKKAFLQGLFDSDGTITKRKEIKYSTTSRIMANQVQQLLLDLEITSRINVWIKAQKYFPLYTVILNSNASRNKYAKIVSSRHPIKKLLLNKFFNSPFV